MSILLRRKTGKENDKEEIWEVKLGSEHPDPQRSRESLANIEARLCENDE